MKNSHFYNILSEYYDEMIHFDKSLQNRKELLHPFAENRETALDIGCGTGLDSICLSKLGLKVDGIDPSPQMLKKAKSNCKKYGVAVDFFNIGITELNKIERKKYDLIVSLGNTFANIPENNIGPGLEILAERLSKTGILIIQLINYSKILKSNNFIINNFENSRVEIKRYNEYSKNQLYFLTTITDKSTNEQQTLRTKIYGGNGSEIIKTSERLNLSLKIYGSLKLSSYEENNSKDQIIILSKKPIDSRVKK